MWFVARGVVHRNEHVDEFPQAAKPQPSLCKLPALRSNHPQGITSIPQFRQYAPHCGEATSQPVVIRGVAGSVFLDETFHNAGASKLADLLKLHPIRGFKQPSHRIFQRYSHRRDENFRWMRSATHRLPRVIEAVENEFGSIDKRAVQVEEDGFALMDLRKNHVVVFGEESYLRQFTDQNRQTTGT